MNIVFLLRYWPVYGGGETVTRILANKLVEDGYNVSVVYLWENRQDDMPFIDERISEYKLGGVSRPYGAEGICKHDYNIIQRELANYFNHNVTDIIIDQWLPANIVHKAIENKKIRLICCIHTNIFIKPSTKKLAYKLFFAMTGKIGERIFWKKKFHAIVNHSDKIILLCNEYLQDLRKLFSLDDSNDKLRVIPNPLSYYAPFSNEIIAHKEKELLFVGRIIEPVKRLSYLLWVWKVLQEAAKTSGWKLTIVGDGEDLNYAKKLASEMRCQNVFFEGRQNPTAYYCRAAIFVFASSFEGWGMTLVEAQQYGCVPIVMDSYASLHDIIKNGKDGVIVKNNDIRAYAAALERLMYDDEYRRRLAFGGMESCKRFAISNVIPQWKSLFEELLHESTCHQSGFLKKT